MTLMVLDVLARNLVGNALIDFLSWDALSRDAIDVSILPVPCSDDVLNRLPYKCQLAAAGSSGSPRLGLH